MNFIIYSTFQNSLDRLKADDQKQSKITAMDLQLNPTSPGHNFHKLDRARDPRFWSVRVNRDLRIIVYRDASRLILCYVDHHDNAYRWAQKRKLETNPKTGSAQIVEIREEVEIVKKYEVETEIFLEGEIVFVILGRLSISLEGFVSYENPTRLRPG